MQIPLWLGLCKQTREGSRAQNPPAELVAVMRTQPEALFGTGNDMILSRHMYSETCKATRAARRSAGQSQIGVRTQLLTRALHETLV